MTGGSSYHLAITKLSLTLVGLFGLTLAIWIWGNEPFFSTVLHQSVAQFNTLSPDEYPKTEYTHQQSSDIEFSSNPSSTEVSSQSPAEGIFSVTDEAGAGGKVEVRGKLKPKADIQPVAVGQNGSSIQTEDVVNSKMATSDRKDCNYAKGKWVADSKWPLYSGFGCKQWLSGPWACRLGKREDYSFEKYRWQPQGCQMPEFEASKFLKRMQHKTLALVGDSLGRQQFQSLMCMLTGGRENHEVEDVASQYGVAIKPGARRPDGWVYRFPQTNTTILFYWSASLCEIEPINRTDLATNYALHLDRPVTFIKKFIDKFDVLVLNTGHHWNWDKFASNKWVLYDNGMPTTDEKLTQLWIAKNRTVYSIVKWLDSQLPQYPRLRVFFRTVAPRHFVNGDWNTGGSCYSTAPLSGGSEVTKDGSADPATESALKGTRVELLDITGLSQLRDEGHIAQYKSRTGAYDCLHWCLPGIPDTWNEILAAQV